ncbi:MAG: nucleoside hydrolase [Firmicutes bacterium]|nr:nucleoside hydrolase [Ezakiella sp.]MDD7762178.1 nucleoside hydrolase [Bacillota bacterium]
MIKLIIDFDNSINIKGCDVDDAFALFLLISSPEVEIELVSTTHGNSDEFSIYKSTLNMFDELGLCYELAKGGYYYKDAAKRICEIVNTKDDINILTLGATTNIRKALDYGMDASRVKSLTMMGGITSELKFKSQVMDELNLSVDYLSTIEVLKAIDNINIITGNNCMPHRYKIDEKTEFKSVYLNYIKEHLLRWLVDNKIRYDEDETVVWDAIAALYLIRPELFDNKDKNIRLGKNLIKGYLEEGSDKKINLPEIKSGVEVMNTIIDIIENRR